MNDTVSYETALAELEQLVVALERGDSSLEAMLAAYRRGGELLKYCQSCLANVEQQIKLLDGEQLSTFNSEE